jgi:hypothetical protein
MNTTSATKQTSTFLNSQIKKGMRVAKVKTPCKCTNDNKIVGRGIKHK